MGRIFVAQNSFARCTVGACLHLERPKRTILSGVEVALVVECGCNAVSNVDEAVHLRRLRGACSSGSRSTSGGETPNSSVRRFVHERDHLRDVVFLVFVVRIEDDMKSRRNI